MFVHPRYGICAPEQGWVPAPSYLLRRHRVLSLVRDLPPGRALEIGCGAGALLHDLTRLGFVCSALETSPRAAAIARAIHRNNPSVTIRQSPEEGWEGRFEYVLSFEVLEHIKDDLGALLQWHRWLKPGGRLVLSVPARRTRWTASDEWAGHYRRYERASLARLLERAGFRCEHTECYGFPFANMVGLMRSRYHARLLRRERTSPDGEARKAEHTGRSGIERGIEVRLFPVFSSWPVVKLMGLCNRLQSWFGRWDLGDGYLILARRQG